jgi:hypothetical protein
LDDAQQTFGMGTVLQTLFAISRLQFEPVTICHELRLPALELSPIGLCIGTVSQSTHDIRHRKIPLLLCVNPDRPDFLIFK